MGPVCNQWFQKGDEQSVRISKSRLSGRRKTKRKLIKYD